MPYKMGFATKRVRFTFPGSIKHFMKHSSHCVVAFQDHELKKAFAEVAYQMQQEDVRKEMSKEEFLKDIIEQARMVVKYGEVESTKNTSGNLNIEISFPMLHSNSCEGSIPGSIMCYPSKEHKSSNLKLNEIIAEKWDKKDTDRLVEVFGGITDERVGNHAQLLKKKLRGKLEQYQIDKDSPLVIALEDQLVGGKLQPELDGFRRCTKRTFETYYPLALSKNRELPVCDRLVGILHVPKMSEIIALCPGAELDTSGNPNSILDMHLSREFVVEVIIDVTAKYMMFQYK